MILLHKENKLAVNFIKFKKKIREKNLCYLVIQTGF